MSKPTSEPVSPAEAAGKAGPGDTAAPVRKSARSARSAAARSVPSAAEIVKGFPYGIASLSSAGVLLDLNPAGRELLGEAASDYTRREMTCCEVFGCRSNGALEGSCLTELARGRDAPLPEVRLDLQTASRARAVWVTASRLGTAEPTILVSMRPGDPRDRRQRTQPHWTADRRLEIAALGRTSVRSVEGPLGGNWLAQRPGQLLKYLVAERHRVVYADEIAEALWPGREQGVLNNVRYFVHTLRDRLEPDRAKRGLSSFVISEAGGYRLNLELVEVDADRFERGIRAGRAAASAGATAEAQRLLEESMSLYRGDFMSDEPYALWTLNERERLRSLAAGALEALTAIALDEGDTSAAMEHLERQAQMHPFDSGVERRLITLALRLGQQTFARRRYAAFRMRLLREFGYPPEFELADLVRELAAEHGSHTSSRP